MDGATDAGQTGADFSVACIPQCARRWELLNKAVKRYDWTVEVRHGANVSCALATCGHRLCSDQVVS